MNPQFAAAAAVSLIRAQLKQATHDRLMMDAEQNKVAYAYARCAERELVLKELLAEAVKLLNAITNGEEWYIQPDGHVRVPNQQKFIAASSQERLEI